MVKAVINKIRQYLTKNVQNVTFAIYTLGTEMCVYKSILTLSAVIY